MRKHKEQPRIVLHVVGRLDMGGAESRIMDIYRCMDRSRVQFYFVQHTRDRCFFVQEIEELGGQVFYVPRFNVKNILAYRRAWRELFKAHPEIQIVQGHMTSTAAIYLPIAKKAGVKVTIAHARSAGVDPGLKGMLTRFLRRKLSGKCDYCFTCSRLAGESVFGRKAMAAGKVELIPNAIQVDRFVFDAVERRRLRVELGLSDTFVLGHVGRFSPVKNHAYLLEILEQCVKKEKAGKLPPFMMILLGDGELKEKIRQQTEQKGLSDRVLFLGNQKEVYRYYQAMDFFLLPSFYEGLPGTAIEAQASGLKGILSDTITEEAVVTDLLLQLSIREPAERWAENILEAAAHRTADRDKLLEAAAGEEAKDTAIVYERRGYAAKVKAAGYDVAEQAAGLQKFYLSGESMKGSACRQ